MTDVIDYIESRIAALKIKRDSEVRNGSLTQHETGGRIDELTKVQSMLKKDQQLNLF